MATDDDADDDGALGKPLPPEDRLWRHPSEMGREGARQQVILVTKGSWWRIALVAVLASLVGAGTTLSVIAATGGFQADTTATPPYEKLPVDPSPPGKSDLEIADKVLPAVATIQAMGPKGTVNGTGVVFRSDGHIITTAQVVNGADSISVVLNDGTKIPAQLVGRSVENDIAVVKIDQPPMSFAAPANAGIDEGTHIVIIDAAKSTRAPEVSAGFVSSASREVKSESDQTLYGLVEVQTRGTVDAREPGALFVQANGAVVGLVTRRTAEGGDVAEQRNVQFDPTRAQVDRAFHFAIPADLAWSVAAAIVDEKQVVKPILGVSGSDLTRDEATRLEVAGGARINRPTDAGPAEKAGLRADDVIVELDEKTITSYNDLVVEIRHHRPGDSVTVTYIRNNERNTTIAELAGKPETP